MRGLVAADATRGAAQGRPGVDEVPLPDPFEEVKGG